MICRDHPHIGPGAACRTQESPIEPRAPSPIATLYGEHHAWLQDWLRRRLGSAADAADLAQDAFVRLLRGTVAANLDSPPKARAYLKTVGNALCVDLWRRRQIEQAWLDTLAAQPQANAPSAEHHAIVLDTLMAVGRMLERLPAKAALAFVLAQVQGLTYREIGSELGVSERMVKKYMASAMLECALLEAGLHD